MDKLVYIIDLDGTVWEDTPNEIAHTHTKDAKVFDNAIEWINRKYDEGNYICLLTARTEALRKITQDKLDSIDLKYHQLMLNKPRTRHTDFKGYHYIDNCAVLKSSRFEGVWSEMTEKEKKITVFE
tara:strand:- start:236 stop:613 length:378 start_codon:yes stop_codon:yes gene_type:complete